MLIALHGLHGLFGYAEKGWRKDVADMGLIATLTAGPIVILVYIHTQ